MLPSFSKDMHFIAEFTCLKEPLVLQQACSTTGCTESPSHASEPKEGNRVQGCPMATDAVQLSEMQRARVLGNQQPPTTIPRGGFGDKSWPQTRPRRESDAGTLCEMPRSLHLDQVDWRLWKMHGFLVLQSPWYQMEVTLYLTSSLCSC